MAWASGNKRWTVSFVSYNGTSCRIDIYKRGYTGSTVDELTSAADPFEYDESNDEDLLNGVIRYRSGYIRLIESDYGDLDEIYPQVNTDRYVEFYYGETLDFTGFIMASEYVNGWEDGPRLVELPIISPLGLASGTTFDYTSYNPPSWITLRRVIRDSLNLLNAGYTSFYFPKYIESEDSLDLVVNGLYLNSLVICPFGNAYDKRYASLTGIYAPKTVADALTIICTGFGLIVHDVPGNPVFQRVDYDGDYSLNGFDGSHTRVEQGTTDMTSVATIASDRNTISKVIPLSKIEVTYDGSEDIPGMTFDRCRGYSRGCAIDDHSFCTNIPNIADFSGTIESAISIDSSGMITAGNVGLGAYGSGSLSEMIIFRPADNVGWGTNHLVCSYTFYEWNGEAVRLQFKHQYGESIENLDNPEYVNLMTRFYATIGVTVKMGQNTLTSKSWNDGRVDCEIGFLTNVQAAPQPLTVEFYSVDGNISDWIHTISDVKLVKYDSATNAYLNKNANPNSFTISGSPSDTEGSVTRGCGILAKTQNRLRYNSANIPGTAEVELMNKEPTYPYLLTVQDRLSVDVKMTYQTAPAIYLNQISVWGSNGVWRTIARSFRAADDVHTFTFHHSTAFD